MRAHHLDAAAVEAATPASRDRVVDLLRVFSITVVVLGHWLMAVVIWTDGRTQVDNALRFTPGLWLATWVLQVMPVFFFVGGFSHAVAWRSVRARGGGYAEFAAGRVARLMRPTAVFLAAWLVAGPIVQATAGDIVGTVVRDLARPLWFLGIYLIAVAVAPAMLRLHERAGWRAPAALFAGAIVVDVLQLALDVPYVGYLNFGSVWLFAHQLGFFYADGSLTRISRRALWSVAAAMLGALAVLVGSGVYPGSMVGLPGEKFSNMNPPTMCLVLLTTWMVALAMLLRPWLARVAARPRAWQRIVAGNTMIMTVFLWHITALMIGVVVWHVVGLPEPAPGSAVFFAYRPLWIAVMAAFLAPLVVAFGRFEPVRARPAAPTTGRAIVAQILVILGVLGFAIGGFSDPFTPEGRELIVLPVFPLQSLLLLAAGLWLMRPTASRRAAAASGRSRRG